MKSYVLVEYEPDKWAHWSHIWDQLRNSGWKVRTCRPIGEEEIDKILHPKKGLDSDCICAKAARADGYIATFGNDACINCHLMDEHTPSCTNCGETHNGK